MKTMRVKHLFALLVAFLLLGAWPRIAIGQPEGCFLPEEHPEIVEALSGIECGDGALEGLADAGTNWTELWEAIEALQGTLRAHACWLVANMPHLDRLEMTRSCLLEHARFAYATRTQLPYVAPQDMFREYILTYRIGDEPVRPWRAEIWHRFSDIVGDSPAETARAINEWVGENLSVRDRGFFGPRPDPLSVIAAGTGTESDIAAVAIAMCKTFGVPARQARISVLGEEEGDRTWLEIYSDGEWLPMYPDQPEEFGDVGLIERDHPHNVTVVSVLAAFTNEQVTSRYSETGEIRLIFTRNGESIDDFEHFAIGAWNCGAWQPLDDLGFDLEEERMAAEGEEGFVAVLGEGFYMIEAGVRNARGDAYVQTIPVTLNPGDEKELTIALDIPASASESVDLVQRTLDPLPEVDLLYASEGGSLMFPEALDAAKCTCIFIFDPGSEPSIRMAPAISEWALAEGVALYAIGVGDPGSAEDFWSDLGLEEMESARFFHDPDGTISEAFGHTPDDDGVYTKLPCVILLTPNREVVYLSDGYNLSIAEALARALELAETE
jgi:hypothetical protein